MLSLPLIHNIENSQLSLTGSLDTTNPVHEPTFSHKKVLKGAEEMISSATIKKCFNKLNLHDKNKLLIYK